MTAAPDLLVRTGDAAYPLRSGSTATVGRDPASDIVLADEYVSWRHAVLRTDGDIWVFEDLGSSNGSYLNAERTPRIEITADCTVRLGNPDDGPVRAGEFAASAVYPRYVAPRHVTGPLPDGQQLALAPPAQRRRGPRQLATLTRRYARVIAADRGYVLFMGLLPLVLGMLIRLVPAKQGLAGPPGNMSAQELLQILVTCACLAGTASSIRELVKERAIYVRELAAGLSPGAYLLSKLPVLGAISVAQSCVIVLLGLAGRPLPARGAARHGADGGARTHLPGGDLDPAAPSRPAPPPLSRPLATPGGGKANGK